MDNQNEINNINQSNQEQQGYNIQQNNQIQQNNNIQQNNQMQQNNNIQQNNQMQQNNNFQYGNQMKQNSTMSQNSQPYQGRPIVGKEDLIKYRQKKAQELAKAKVWFQKLAIPSFIYALIYTFCIYKNNCGIAVVFWVLAAIVYLHQVMKICEIKKKRGSIFMSIVMFLLGFSTFLTDNGYIIFMNYVAFFLLLILFLLYQMTSIGNWTIGKAISELFYAVCGAISNLFSPFIDADAWWNNYRKKQTKWGHQVGLGLLIAAPCVIILASFLASADAVFGNFIKTILLEISFTNLIHMGILFCFGFFSSYCGVRFCFGTYQERKSKSIEKIEPIMAITFTAAILLLYLCFCWIQIVYLFVGYGELPDGVTYASYARTGFFQLLFVCILNLMLVLGVKKYFQENKILNGILLAICVCSYIMTASSVYRMALYISVYRLTFLRVFVLIALFVITVLLTFVVIRVLKTEFPIFRYSLVTICIVYLVFSFSHIDYIIASYDLAHADDADQIERNRGYRSILDYVSSLSTDAAPAIRSYLDKNEDMKDQIENYLDKYDSNKYGDYVYMEEYKEIQWYLDYLKDNEDKIERHGIRTFNLSHKIAENVLIR